MWLELDLPVADYTVKYQFFEKELAKKAASSKSIEEDDVETSTSTCQLPYIKQELVIVDKQLLKQRVEQFDPSGLPDLSDEIKCQVDVVDESKVDPEFGWILPSGLYCDELTYRYEFPTEGKTILERPISVRGVANAAIVYKVHLHVGFDFVTGAGVRVLLKRESRNMPIRNDGDIFACLVDHSCQEAQMSSKNH